MGSREGEVLASNSGVNKLGVRTCFRGFYGMLKFCGGCLILNRAGLPLKAYKGKKYIHIDRFCRQNLGSICDQKKIDINRRSVRSELAKYQ